MTERHVDSCPICQKAIAEAQPEIAKALREGKIVYPHGQAITPDEYPDLFRAIRKPTND